jgi:hypothetical protein
MIRPPSLRSAVLTVAAAVVLVGGAGLASYARSGHQPLQSPRAGTVPKSYQVVLTHAKKKYTDSAFVTATVPHGSYEVSLSGKITPDADGSLECFVSDKTYWTSSHPRAAQLWADDRQPLVDRNGATLNAVGTARVGKGAKVTVGCVFGVPTWTVEKPIVATLTPVKAFDQRPTRVFAPDRNAVPGGR